MYLTKQLAKELKELGFERPEYSDKYSQYDFYDYDGEEWVLGGRILPSSTLLAPQQIYSEGVWLPSLHDLVLWLEENNCNYNLCFDGKVYKLSVSDESGNLYNGKGASLDIACFNAITKILAAHNGNPVKKEYTVHNATYIKESGRANGHE